MCIPYLVVDIDVDPKQDLQFIERKKSLEEMQERIKREDCLTNLFWLKE